MARMKVLVTVGVLVTVTGLCAAKSTSDLAEENAQLRDRVENLEEQVQDLAAGAGVQGQPPGPAEAKKPMWSNLDVQFYGFVKADAAYDTARTTTGNYVLWVESEANKKDDDEFNLTANETQLGVAIAGPKNGRMEVSGRVEVDFYGGDAPENRARIQMRHAYLQLLWPESHLGLLGGQAWDVISPLNAPTINYTVLWAAGNIGYRRPQIRLTKELTVDGDKTLQVAGAMARTIGRDSPLPGIDSESGEDAGFPTLQGRVGLTFPWLAAGPTTVGVSGHWGQEEYDVTVTGTHKDFDTWSINLDVIQPVNAWLSFQAEAFRGENLDAYLGGIGQGVNTTALKEIASKGGWVAATIKPNGPVTFNVGIGIDDVNANDVNVGDRTLNRSIFGNLIYAVNKQVDVGLEVSHWRTDYSGPGDADSVRLQTALKYKF